jgi:hypothetical protein
LNFNKIFDALPLDEYLLKKEVLRKMVRKIVAAKAMKNRREDKEEQQKAQQAQNQNK